MIPKQGEQWMLKSDNRKVLLISYINCNDFVGYREASWMKRDYGTLNLETFLERYEMSQQ